MSLTRWDSDINNTPFKSFSEDEVIKERNNKLVNMDKPIVRQDFMSYSYFKLKEMLHSAVFNGFESGWKR